MNAEANSDGALTKEAASMPAMAGTSATLRSRLRASALRMSRRYHRLRCMPYKDALRYLRASLSGKVAPQRFSVLGFDVLMRPGTTDLEVACESLGGELEPAISYLPAGFSGAIVDAGGYIGTSALKLARSFPDATIYVLEPSNANFAILCKNVSNVSNVTPINAALSAETGETVMRDRGTGHWGFTIVADPADTRDTSELNATKTYSIDGFLRAMAVDEIGILKMDIEGGEDQLLAAASDWLDKTDLLIIELHDWIVPGVERRFAEVTKDRANLKLPGEKYVSIRKSAAGSRA